MAALKNIRARAAGAINRERFVRGLAHLRHRAPTALRERRHRVEANVVLALQAGLAGAIAWYISHDFFGQPQAVFSPIAAVGTLAASVGQRLRNTVETVLGVALGVGIGDAVILGIGTGWWQLGLVTIAAIIIAIFVGGGPALITQAAGSAVLIATLSPPTGGILVGRFFDALTGGVVGIAVIALLLPLKPLAVVRRAAEPAMDILATALGEAGAALTDRDHPKAGAALERLRGGEDELSAMQEALQAGQETTAVAPVRWRHKGALTQYARSSEFILRSVRNGRVLSRRCMILIEEREPVPDPLPRTLTSLADAVVLLERELADGVEPMATRERLLLAATQAGEAYAAGLGFSGSVIIAQARAIAIDLIQATGLGPEDANQVIRQAVGRRAPNQPG